MTTVETEKSPTSASERFLALASAVPGSDSPLGAIRAAALEELSQLQFPTTRLEDWRFTNIDRVARLPFVLGLPSTVDVARLAEHVIENVDVRVVFLNGVHAPGLALSRQSEVSVTALDDITEDQLERLGSITPDDYFPILNQALPAGGVVIDAPKGARAVIHLLHLAVPGENPAVANIRHLVIAGESAQLTVIETFATTGDGVVLTNAVTEIFSGENAVVEHVRLQRENRSSHHFGSVSVQQEASSTVTTSSFAAGAAISRQDVRVTLAGQGASCTLNGLYLTNGNQLADHHTLIDHAVPHCTSVEFYKGVLDGSSRAVFDGRIIVRKDAQKTSSGQTNRNLLLSPDAIVDSKPQLEIFADDVKCTHGSTIGQLDEESMFYLRSRGIGAEEARSMLTLAFAAEVIERVRFAPLRDMLTLSLLEGIQQPAIAEGR